MKTNYILIDYENVQPKNLSILKDHDFRVIVFVGANQTKLPFELVDALQALGSKAEYIKISGNGPNALDFHIAYYIGALAAEDPSAYFHIVSKDTGFDPLIKHLKTKKIHVMREKALAEIPLLRISNADTSEEKIAAIVKSFVARGQSRPRKMKTLTNTIHALFMKTLDDNELAAIVAQMKSRKLISVDGDKITYQLPTS